jgi:hypothetical protein
MTKNNKQNREQNKDKKKTILEKKKRFLLFFQTSNLHLVKQKYKSFLKIIFIIKHIRKTKFFEKENSNKINK